MSNYPIYNDSNNLEQNTNNYRSTYVLTKDTTIWGVYQPGFYGFFGSGTQSSTNWSLESIGSSLILQWGDNKYTYNPSFSDDLYVFKLYWDSGLYIDTGFEQTQLISDAILKDNPTYWGSIGDIFSYNSPYEIKVFDSSQNTLWEERFRRYLYNKHKKNYYPTLLQYNFEPGNESSFDVIIQGSDDMSLLVEYGGNSFYYTQSYVQLSMPNYSTASYNNDYKIISNRTVHSWAVLPHSLYLTNGYAFEITIYNWQANSSAGTIIGNYGSDNYFFGLRNQDNVTYFSTRDGVNIVEGSLYPEQNLDNKSFILKFNVGNYWDITVKSLITNEIIAYSYNNNITVNAGLEILFGSYQSSIARRLYGDFEDLKIYYNNDIIHWWPLHNTGDGIAWDIVGNNHGLWQVEDWVWSNKSFNNIWGYSDYNYWTNDKKLIGGWTQSTLLANTTDKWQFEWEIYKLHSGSSSDSLFGTFFNNTIELSELNGTVSWVKLNYSGSTDDTMYLKHDESIEINKGLQDNSMMPFNLKLSHDGHNNITYTVQDTFTAMDSVPDASITFGQLYKVVGGFEGSVKKAVFNNYSQSQTITFVEDFDIKRGYVWNESSNNYHHYTNQPGGQLGDTALSGEILNWDDLGSDEIKFNFYLAHYTYSNTIKHILSNGANFIGWYNKQPIVKLGTLSFYGNDIEFSDYYTNEWRFNRTTGENVDVIVKNFNDDVLLGYYTFSNVRWIGTSSNSFNHMFGFTQSYFDGTFVYSEKYKNNHLINKWINLGESNTVYDPINAKHLTILNSENYHTLQSYWGWDKESSRLEYMTNGTYSINVPLGDSLFRYDENYDQFYSQTGEYELVPYNRNIYSFKGAYYNVYSFNGDDEYLTIPTFTCFENNGDYIEFGLGDYDATTNTRPYLVTGNSPYTSNTLEFGNDTPYLRMQLGSGNTWAANIVSDSGWQVQDIKILRLTRNTATTINVYVQHRNGASYNKDYTKIIGSDDFDTIPFRFNNFFYYPNQNRYEYGILTYFIHNGTVYDYDNNPFSETSSNYTVKQAYANTEYNTSVDIYGFTLSTTYHELFEIEKVDNREFRYKYAESVNTLSLSTGTPFVIHLLNDTDLQNTINWQIGEKYRIRFIYSGAYKYYGNDQLTIKIHGLPDGTPFDYTRFLWNENKITDTVSSDVGIIALNYLWKAFDIQEASVDFIIPDNYNGDNIWIEFDTNDITYHHDLKAYMSIKDLEVLHIPKTNSWTRVNDDETYNRVYPPTTTIESKYLPLRYKNYNENNGYAYKQNSELTTINKVPTYVGNYNSWAYYTGRPYDYITVKSLKPWNVGTVSYSPITSSVYLTNYYSDYTFNYIEDNLTKSKLKVYLRPENYSGSTWTNIAETINNNVTIYNGPTLNSNSISFNGSNQYGRFDEHLRYEQLTVDFWVKNPSNIIISHDFRNWEIFIGSTEFAGYFGIDNGSFWTGISDSYNINHDADLTIWNNFTYTYDFINKEVKLYCNGVLKGTIQNSNMRSNYTTYTTKPDIARRNNASLYYSGEIGILRIFDKILTTEEIERDYNYLRNVYNV